MFKVLETHQFWDGFGFKNLDPQELKRRTSAVYASGLTVGIGLIHSCVYVILGFPYITIAVLAYAVCGISSLIYLRLTHDFDKFKTIQLSLIVVFPIAAQLSIGGFVNSSAVAVASFISPATALLYTKSTTARMYFFAFVALFIIAAVIETQFNRQPITLPIPIINAFFTINVIATLGIIYFLMESFLKKQIELQQELRNSIEFIKSTQAQLIQAEKMASLGELTAGIAHEIQNPLNFVNNFSEVSAELLDELQEELAKGDLEEALVIANDLQANLNKINHHGKRADGIVKGMLQHSRASTGKKQLININTLTDEYLRLSYHGLRAKDKSFNAELQTSFFQGREMIEVVPQDIGRVLLNLFNNAFYSVLQKQKISGSDYKPLVCATTQVIGDESEIKVKDNGVGISEENIQKILQPFFTTKPTGQGTGLGLSISYDIVTKGHGGTLNINTKEGEYAEFVILLPLNPIPVLEA